MTNELLEELRRASNLFADDGWWRPDILEKAADEIERLNRKCSALAFLQYGSSGPDDPWQAKLDEVTKPLHAEIERLQRREDAARAILEPLYSCDQDIRDWLKGAPEPSAPLECVCKGCPVHGIPKYMSPEPSVGHVHDWQPKDGLLRCSICLEER